MHNKYKRWPYTSHTIRYIRKRERRNRMADKEREKIVDTVDVQERTDLSPRMKNQINLLLSEAEKLGKLAVSEGDADMAGLAAMVTTTFELLMGIEE